MTAEHATARVRAAVTRVEQALEAVTAAQKTLHTETITALMALDGDDERELVRHLYWFVPTVPVTALQGIVGGQARVRELAGPGPPLGSCDGCGAEVRARSRSQLTAGGHPIRCDACERRWRYGPLEPTPPPPPQWHAAFEEHTYEPDVSP